MVPYGRPYIEKLWGEYVFLCACHIKKPTYSTYWKNQDIICVQTHNTILHTLLTRLNGDFNNEHDSVGREGTPSDVFSFLACPTLLKSLCTHAAGNVGMMKIDASLSHSILTLSILMQPPISGVNHKGNNGKIIAPCKHIDWFIVQIELTNYVLLLQMLFG